MPENLVDEFIDAYAIVNDELTNVFKTPDNSTLTLLTRSTTADEFDTEAVVASGWLIEYTEDGINVDIATNVGATNTSIQTATHIQVNTTIYTIVSGNNELPDGFDPTWELVCERFDNSSQVGAIY